MLDRIRRERADRCTHPLVLTTRNHGIERTVCETCGNVSVQLLDYRASDQELIGTAHQPR